MNCSCLTRPLGSGSLFASSSRLASAAPSSARLIHAPASMPVRRRVPEMRGSLTSPLAILSLSKRNLESYASKIIPADLDAQAAWTALFTKSSAELAEAGMTVQERRYLLWFLEKFRQGEDLRKVAHAEKPKKTIRGWGPRVQNGVAVR